MKASAVYRKAAQRIFDGHNTLSCYAIEDVINNTFKHWHSFTIRYRQVFANYGKDMRSTPFYKCENPRLVRVLALLLMSEIARDEEGR